MSPPLKYPAKQLRPLGQMEEGLLPVAEPLENSTKKTWFNSWGCHFFTKCHFEPDRGDFTGAFFTLMGVAISSVSRFNSSLALPQYIWDSLAGFSSILGMDLRYTAKLSLKDKTLNEQCTKLIKDMVLLRAQCIASQQENNTLQTQLFENSVNIVIAAKEVHQKNNNKMMKDILLLLPYFTSFALSLFWSLKVDDKPFDNNPSTQNATVTSSGSSEANPNTHEDSDNNMSYIRNMTLLAVNVLSMCMALWQIKCARDRKKETKKYRNYVNTAHIQTNWNAQVANQSTSIAKASHTVLEPKVYQELGLDANDIDEIKMILRNDPLVDSVDICIGQAIIDVLNKLTQGSSDDKNNMVYTRDQLSIAENRTSSFSARDRI